MATPAEYRPNLSELMDSRIVHDEESTTVNFETYEVANLQRLNLAQLGSLLCLEPVSQDKNILVYKKFKPFSEFYHEKRDEFLNSDELLPDGNYAEHQKRQERWVTKVFAVSLIMECFDLMKQLHSQNMFFSNWAYGLGFREDYKIKIFDFGNEEQTREKDRTSFLNFIDDVLCHRCLTQSGDGYTNYRSHNVGFYTSHGLSNNLSYALFTLKDYTRNSSVLEYLDIATFWDSRQRIDFVRKMQAIVWKVEFVDSSWRKVYSDSKVAKLFRYMLNSKLWEGGLYDWKKRVVETNKEVFQGPFSFADESNSNSPYSTSCHVITYLRNFIEHPPEMASARTPYEIEELVNGEFAFVESIYIAFRKYLYEKITPQVGTKEMPKRVLDKKIRHFLGW